MTINTMACTPVPLLLLRNLGSGSGTFYFGCGVDLGSCGIVMVECCGEFWLRQLSQDLFSARVSREILFVLYIGLGAISDKAGGCF